VCVCVCKRKRERERERKRKQIMKQNLLVIYYILNVIYYMLIIINYTLKQQDNYCTIKLKHNFIKLPIKNNSAYEIIDLQKKII